MTINLGPQHVFALNKARNAVLAEQRRFQQAADAYHRGDAQRSEKAMSDEAWACRQVAQFLAELRDAAREQESETSS